MATETNKISFVMDAEDYKGLMVVAAIKGKKPGPYMRKVAIEIAQKGKNAKLASKGR